MIADYVGCFDIVAKVHGLLVRVVNNYLVAGVAVSATTDLKFK